MQEEIFKTKRASIKQCELTDSFLLTFEREEFVFKLCDLFAFRKKIMALDLIALLESSAPDVEIIHLPNCDRFLVLSLKEILEFRELLNGTFNTLALNSAVRRIFRRNVFNF
ncbi:MAG: hypothetical protein GDA42_10710 [Ekhidna sp.]|nr:hypothetical protein [Ekhidna sp.]MBC6410905.1 hypothetical protein [Ekhidna sp.]